MVTRRRLCAAIAGGSLLVAGSVACSDDDAAECLSIEDRGGDEQYAHLRSDIADLQELEEEPDDVVIIQSVADRIFEAVEGACPDDALTFVRQLGLDRSTLLDYSALEPDVDIGQVSMYHPDQAILDHDGHRVVTVRYVFTCARGEEPTRSCR